MDDYSKDVKIFKALCDEKRLAILNHLKSGEKCACVLIEYMNIGQSALSYHMKMMKDCGLVDSRKDGIWVKYSVNHEKLDELKDFFQTMAKQNTTV